MTEVHERRYAIKTHEVYSFYAGVTPENEQVLMGLYCPNLVAFRFNGDGKLLRVEHRPVPIFQGVTPPYDIYDGQIPPLIEAWKQEMQLRLATIKVNRFFTEELGIGIEDYPSHFDEILSDPITDDNEKADIRDSIALWDKDGQFVLWWGNDYWLDGTGEVTSS